MQLFDVPKEKRVRVFISTDTKNEADDQYALVYALLSPKIDVVGIAAAHFDKKEPKPVNSVQQSYDEILLILDKMGLRGKVPVLMGAPAGIEDENAPQPSEAARFLVEEAMKDGPPLYVASLGAITDLASAYLIEPGIARRIAASVWLGGGRRPTGGAEFNLMNDIHAANVLMKSPMPFWLIPVDASVCLRVSVAELLTRVYPHGEIGRYLVHQLLEVNKKEQWTNGENWILWDMAGIGLILDPHTFQYDEEPAPLFDGEMRYVPCPSNRAIRIYNRVEPRYLMEDFYAKLLLASSKA